MHHNLRTEDDFVSFFHAHRERITYPTPPVSLANPCLRAEHSEDVRAELFTLSLAR